MLSILEFPSYHIRQLINIRHVLQLAVIQSITPSHVFIKPIPRSNISLATYIHVGVWIVCKRYHPCGVDKISCKSKYSSVRSYDEQTLLLHIKFRLSGEFAIIDNGDVVCQHRLPVICAPRDVILTKNIIVVSSSFSRPRPMG